MRKYIEYVILAVGSKVKSRSRFPINVAAPDVRYVSEENTVGDNSGYIVIVYDNDKNTYAEVIGILCTATGCSVNEAYIEAWEIDHIGKSVVHHGSRQECERAAAIIRQIGIRVDVAEE